MMALKIDNKLMKWARDITFSFGAKTPESTLVKEMKNLIPADTQYTDAEIIQALIKARETY